MTDTELLATFRREGMLPALVAAARLLNARGLEKHGVQGWREHPADELRSKAIRHTSQAGTEDEDTGEDHAVCGLVRAMMLVTVLEERK